MYGVEDRNGEDFPTKKSFRDAVKTDPKSFRMFDTSAFDPDPDHNGTTIPEGKRFYIAGPNVYRNRKWYANLVKRNGKLIVT